MARQPAELMRSLESGQADAVEAGTDLEARAPSSGCSYIELDGNVGVLANGAGLTMATLDAIGHLGGRAANFLEIGGDAYTKATPALELVLYNPNVKSLLVNFCGAFARTDVMTEGVVKAIESCARRCRSVFSIHGTGEEEAIALVRDRLGLRALRPDGGRGRGGGRGRPRGDERRRERRERLMIARSEGVLIQGITGQQGSFWTERMSEYGTGWWRARHPARAAETVDGIPVYDSVAEAGRPTTRRRGDVRPAARRQGGCLDAIDAGARIVVLLTEHIPIHDAMEVLADAADRGVRVLGPNTAGLVVPGEARSASCRLRAEHLPARQDRRDLAQRQPRHAARASTSCARGSASRRSSASAATR